MTGETSSVFVRDGTLPLSALTSFSIPIIGNITTSSNLISNIASSTIGIASGMAVVEIGRSGYQVVDVGGAHVGTDLTGLVALTTYTATITIDQVHVQPISVLGSTVTTFDELIGAITLQLAGFASADLVGGNIQVRSYTSGVTSTVSIVNSGANFLFAAPLSGFVAINAAVAGTTTGADVPTNAVTSSGNASIASTHITIDTFATASVPVVLIVRGVTSAPEGGESILAIFDSDSGTSKFRVDSFNYTSLFTAGNTFVVYGSATSGSQVVDVGGAQTPTSLTGLVALTTYTANITIDGTTYPISTLGSAAATYTELIAVINASISGATAALVGGNIKVTSYTTGTFSTVLIVDTGPNFLFASLTTYVAINAAVAGSYVNDKEYTVTSSTFTGGKTNIFVTPAPTTGGASGFIYFTLSLDYAEDGAPLSMATPGTTITFAVAPSLLDNIEVVALR